MATQAPALLESDALETARAILPPDLVEPLADYAERLDLELVTRAYEFSRVAHAGQKRRSGARRAAPGPARTPVRVPREG